MRTVYTVKLRSVCRARRVQRHTQCAGRERSMTAWICATCGVQYPDTEQPPPGCPICSDERQYVGWDGKQWTTIPELGQDHANEVREEEPDLIGLGVTPSFGIGQRALLVRTPAGNLRGTASPARQAHPRAGR